MTLLKSITFWPHQWKFLGAYSVVLAYLYNIGDSLPIVAVLSVAFAGLFAADFLVKTHQEFLGDRSLVDGIENYAVMVTGCDTGFGLHFAQRLARMGFLVYATVMFPDGKGARKLRAFDNIVVVKLDVTLQDEIDSVIENLTAHLTEKKKTLWSLVNNAGIAVYGDFEVASLEHYQRIVDVNTFGPLRMCKAVLPLMRANQQGRIVNITSLSGRYTIPFTTGYSMSKHALIAFSDGLRCEVAPWNISVHTIQPCFYQTHESFDEQVNNTIDQYIKMWGKAPKRVREALGLKFRDARIQALKDICYNHTQPITKIDEVADDMVDAVAGISPQLCYTPRIFTKMAGRILRELPTEVVDKILAPKVKEIPAELLAKEAASTEDQPEPAFKLMLSLFWHYAKLPFKLIMASSVALLNRTAK